MIDEGDGIVLGDGLELVIFDIRQELSRKLNGTQAWIRKAIFTENKAYLMVQKTHIERRIVRNENGIADKLEQCGGDLPENRSVSDHFVVDAGERRYERGYRHLRINESVKLLGDLPPAHAPGSYLGHAAGRGLGAGSFKIENHKIGLEQRAGFESTLDKLDRVIDHPKPRVTVNEVLAEYSGHCGLGPANIHDVIHDLRRGGPAAEHPEKSDSLIYEQ
jgi:hypothetical protein